MLEQERCERVAQAMRREMRREFSSLEQPIKRAAHVVLVQRGPGFGAEYPRWHLGPSASKRLGLALEVKVPKHDGELLAHVHCASADRAIKLLETRIADVRALDSRNVSYKDERVRVTSRRIISNVQEMFGGNSREYHDHEHLDISTGRSSAITGGVFNASYGICKRPCCGSA